MRNEPQIVSQTALFPKQIHLEVARAFGHRPLPALATTVVKENGRLRAIKHLVYPKSPSTLTVYNNPTKGPF